MDVPTFAVLFKKFKIACFLDVRIDRVNGNGTG